MEPMDPGRTGNEVEKIVQGVAHGELTRRQFVERAVGLGLSLSAIGTILAACGTGSDADTGATPAPMDTTLPKEITIFNWADYMSPQCLKDFQAEYGIQVKQVYYDTNEDMFAKMRAGASGYDVIFPTDMWVSILSKSGLIQPLNMDYIPNFKYVTDPVFQKPTFDNPDNQGGKKYSVPYMFGTTGYAARLDKCADPQDSWDQLWDAGWKDKITMLDASRETLGVGLIKSGYSPNTTNQEELDAGTQQCIDQKPLVLKYDSTTMRLIVAGIPLVHCWDGDVGLAIKSIPPSKVKYVLPTEGYIVWADGVAIPTTAPSVYGATLFLNFMLLPKESGQAADYIGYQPVVSEAVQYITSPIQKRMRPTPEQIANGILNEDVGEFQKQYDEAWRRVKAA